MLNPPRDVNVGSRAYGTAYMRKLADDWAQPTGAIRNALEDACDTIDEKDRRIEELEDEVSLLRFVVRAESRDLARSAREEGRRRALRLREMREPQKKGNAR